MADVPGWLGSVATIIVAISTPLLANFAQKGREVRIRSSIAENLKTAKELAEVKPANHDDLQSKLEEALASDFVNLAKTIESRNELKRRNWPSLVVGIVSGLLLTIPLWFLWKPTEWWTITTFVGFAAAALLFFLVSGFAWAHPPKGDQE
jgi:hypothetical protein